MNEENDKKTHKENKKTTGVEKTTPMVRQYLEIKELHPDAILFYRMGDFYEMFFEDAKIASRILNIALTSRDKSKEDSIPLCGVPHHAAASYISKLIQSGHKVAVCEQVEDPKKAKGLVKREVVRIITPGLVLDSETLHSDDNNYLMGICSRGDNYGIASLDLSTGEFRVTEVTGERAMLSEGERIRPREVLFPEGIDEDDPIRKALDQWKPALVNERTKGAFRYERARELLLRQFQVQSLDGFGLEGLREGTQAAGAVLQYARETQKGALPHIQAVRPYHIHDHMFLDDWTRRNLELFENLRDRSRRGTLIAVLDRTQTPMGGRKLRQWLSYPLLDPGAINRRLEAVEAFVQRGDIRDRIRESLQEVQDLERIVSRVSMGTANARDLVSLKESLQSLPVIQSRLKDVSGDLLADTRDKLDTLTDVAEWIQNTLLDDPPLTLREGGLIKEGVDPVLDEWIHISREGKNVISSMEAREKAKTGISTLKIGYNKVFGYYIEVSKAQARSVPPEYVRKQTLVNAERYINEELKEYEFKVINAEEKRTALEHQIFVDLRNRVADQTHRIQATANLIASLDVLASFAQVALERRYVRPLIDDGNGMVIRDGRHPVVEAMGLGERFVPNDLDMDPDSTRMIILTGPNMAGKSTFLRQVALLVLMAQAGSFVPASEMKTGAVDRIFTRVGALDNLAHGQSTFMVEMAETAQILNTATPKSLIILDEIGRGTSTFDGLSIAWAVAEYILENPGIMAKTLFATHYHELTELALTKENVRNFHIAVKEWEERIIFLRRVVEGATSRSYGIQVARLAGLPPDVIRRAQEILSNLENGELNDVGRPRLAEPLTPYVKKQQDPVQMSLFGSKDGWLKEEIRILDPETLTPLEALNLIHQWKNRLKE